MLAHWHGQTWNGSELGRAFGVSHHTTRRYLDILQGTFVVRVLQPWFENIGKRQVKSPKVYLADTGLLHTLLGLDDREAVEGHPKVGASWEGFALDQVVRRLGAEPHECHFWATQSKAELDLLVVRGPVRRAFEFKRTSTPRRTRSMLSSLETLGLESIDVVHPGDDVFPIADQIRGVGLRRVLDAIEPL